MRSPPKTGVGGTVDAFNFIRRVGFPSTRRVLAIFVAIAFISATISLGAAGEGPAQILVFAVAVMSIPPLVGELINSAVFLRGDKILDFRRLIGLEIVSDLPIVGFLFVFAIVAFLTGASRLWADGFLTGLVVSLPIRFLTPLAMSSLKTWRRLLAAGFTPVLMLGTYLILFPGLVSLLQVYTLIAAGLAVSALGTSLIIRSVDAEGTPKIGHSPMRLFRAFLQHWLRKKPDSLEERLLSLSTLGTIDTRILSLSDHGSRPKASVIVSNFHPGPYRDLGSGGLPSKLKQFVENSRPVVVQVPHGVSNHQLNIVSQEQVGRLLQATDENYPVSHSIQSATRMIREQVGEAYVSGQAFGQVALLTITLAPEEMEDLPSEVSSSIDSQASSMGLRVLTIDSHNSIQTQTSITQAQAERIIAAAGKVLNRLKTEPQGAFRIGAANNPLTQFTLTDGIGPGGMAAMTVETQGQVAAYITVDGNNMQRGLRDQILRNLREIGINEGEVMTTDTHLVTGLVRSPLGYYPVGEHLPTARFIGEIRDTVEKARANSEDSSAGLSAFSMQLQVLGSDTFHSITSFIGHMARKIGRSFIWLEISSFLLSMVILFLV
jgi:putative membrane protein